MSWVSWLKISRWKKMLGLCSSFRYICLFGRCAGVGAPWCVSAWSKNTFLLLKIRSRKVSVENSFFSGVRARVGKIFSSAKPICVIDRSEFNCWRESSVAETDVATWSSPIWKCRKKCVQFPFHQFEEKKLNNTSGGEGIAPQTRAINDVRASEWVRAPSVSQEGKIDIGRQCD